MRHRKKGNKLSRSISQRKALIKSLVRSVMISERITTTEAKAKALRPWVEKLITWAKDDSLHHRRLSYRLLNDHVLVKRLFEEIGPRFKDTVGGYTRIIDLGNRKGDDAKLSIFELTKINKKEKKIKDIKKVEEKNISQGDQEPVEEKGKPQQGIVSRMRKIFNKDKGAR